MPKLLSRSKHEEFESDFALQIRDEKERRVENTENLELQEIPTRTVPSYCSFLLFDASDFCYNFLFLPILSLLIPCDFGCFCNFPFVLSIYKPQSVSTFQSINKVTGEAFSSPASALLCSLFSHFLSTFWATKHPPRMTTRRMSG